MCVPANKVGFCGAAGFFVCVVEVILCVPAEFFCVQRNLFRVVGAFSDCKRELPR